MSSEAAATLYRLRGEVAGLTPKLSIELIVPEDASLRRIAGPWRPGVACQMAQDLAPAAGAFARAWLARYVAAADAPERVFALCYLVEGDALALPPAAATAVIGWLGEAFDGRSGAVATADGRNCPDALATAEALAAAARAAAQPFTLDVVVDPTHAAGPEGAAHLETIAQARRAFGQLYLALVAASPLPEPRLVDRLARSAALQVLDIQRHATPATDPTEWRAAMAWLARLVAIWAEDPHAYDLTFAMTLACQLRAQPDDLETLATLLARLLLANLWIDREGRIGFCQGGLFGTGVAMVPHTGGKPVAHLGDDDPQALADALPALAQATARRLIARHLRDPGCGACPLMAACALTGGPRLKQVLPRDAGTEDCPIAVRQVLQAVADHEEDVSYFPFAWTQRGLQGGRFGGATEVGQAMRMSTAPIRWPAPE